MTQFTDPYMHQLASIMWYLPYPSIATWYRYPHLTHWVRDKMTAFFSKHFRIYFLEWDVHISIKISLKFVTKSSINTISALVQITACRRPGDKPLSEPMMVSLLTHIRLTRPRWVNARPDAVHAVKYAVKERPFIVNFSSTYPLVLGAVKTKFVANVLFF